MGAAHPRLPPAAGRAEPLPSLAAGGEPFSITSGSTACDYPPSVASSQAWCEPSCSFATVLTTAP